MTFSCPPWYFRGKIGSPLYITSLMKKQFVLIDLDGSEHLLSLCFFQLDANVTSLL